MSEDNDSLAEEVMGDLQSEAVDGDLAVLTADLQRLQAEYINYRKRVERDRALSHELAVSAVLTELLPILDDIDRAKEHGELQGGFKAIADQLINVTTRIGLQSFGDPGSAFDPQIHEALMHSTSSEVTEPTATAILQPGYKYKERILRPARVAVADPE
jgi:molecular chaperone GrpE